LHIAKVNRKCNTCGYTPCKPWSDKHDKDFEEEIDNYIREKNKEARQ